MVERLGEERPLVAHCIARARRQVGMMRRGPYPAWGDVVEGGGVRSKEGVPRAIYSPAEGLEELTPARPSLSGWGDLQWCGVGWRRMAPVSGSGIGP